MKDLQEPDLWLGSFYELAIEVSPSGDDARLATAVSGMFDAPGLQGPWKEKVDIGRPERSTSILAPSALQQVSMFSLVRLGDLGVVGAEVHSLREVGGSDWLVLCVPCGMLQTVTEVRYPLSRIANPWMDSVDEALTAVAIEVYQSIPFDLALVGEEVSGHTHARDIDFCNENIRYLLSHRLFARLAPTCGMRCRGGLYVLPAGRSPTSRHA